MDIRKLQRAIVDGLEDVLGPEVRPCGNGGSEDEQEQGEAGAQPHHRCTPRIQLPNFSPSQVPNAP